MGEVSESKRKSIICAWGGGVLDFLYVVSFRNQSSSKATEAENRAEISQFRPSVKFRGGVGKMPE